MNSFVKKYAGIALASTVVIGGIASAAITPIPTISNAFAVAGQKILSADINKLAEALNILDARTNGTVPTDPNHLADKEYVDASILKSSAPKPTGSVGVGQIIPFYSIASITTTALPEGKWYIQMEGIENKNSTDEDTDFMMSKVWTVPAGQYLRFRPLAKDQTDIITGVGFNISTESSNTVTTGFTEFTTNGTGDDRAVVYKNATITDNPGIIYMGASGDVTSGLIGYATKIE